MGGIDRGRTDEIGSRNAVFAQPSRTPKSVEVSSQQSISASIREPWLSTPPNNETARSQLLPPSPLPCRLAKMRGGFSRKQCRPPSAALCRAPMTESSSCGLHRSPNRRTELDPRIRKSPLRSSGWRSDIGPVQNTLVRRFARSADAGTDDDAPGSLRSTWPNILAGSIRTWSLEKEAPRSVDRL